MAHPTSSPARSRGLMMLLRDQRAATLPMIAMSVFPLVGMVGGAVDMSRVYLAKTRLQQACDAGVLAGRKRMGGGQWVQDAGAPEQAAKDFFNSNFRNGAYGTANLKSNFVEAAGKVTGTASVDVPMTMMRVFDIEEQSLKVSCDAEMRLPNTDVMFVLDTTGSMASKAVSTDAQTKMQALRSAVKCFYEIVARQDTSENCVTGTPSGGLTTLTQVRFGFVPYATNVNVGKLLPPSYFADEWSYQTRTPIMRTENYTTTTTTTTTTWSNGTRALINTEYKNLSYGTWQQVSNNTVQNQNACNAPSDNPIQFTGPEGNPYDMTGPSVSGNQRTTTWKTDTPGKLEYTYRATYSGGSSKKCLIERMRVTGIVARTWRQTDTSSQQQQVQTHQHTRQVFDKWRYAKMPVNISALKNGSSWNSSFTHAIGNTADASETIASKTINWDGCIEERKTIRASTYTSETGGSARDLDIDTVPTPGDPDSLWGPALHDLIYVRTSTATTLDDNDVGGFSYPEAQSATNYTTLDGNGQDSYFCPAEAKKLQEWKTVSAYENYVDGLTPSGNTYHDIGLIWGARFLSPTGIFKSENALTPKGGEIERHLIFMTDGETCTASYNYGPYGFPWLDRRTTPEGSAPSYGCETETSAGGALSEQVNARYAAVCTSVKNKNITLWVIWFGESKPKLETRLKGCATPGRFYAARNSSDLQKTFASIANQISQLRLTA